MANKDATPEEQRALDLVIKFILDNGYAPSVREVAAMIGRSPSMARLHLTNLQRKGYITRPLNTMRVIRILDRR